MVELLLLNSETIAEKEPVQSIKRLFNGVIE